MTFMNQLPIQKTFASVFKPESSIGDIFRFHLVFTIYDTIDYVLGNAFFPSL